MDVREMFTEQADFVHLAWRLHPWRRDTRGGTHSMPCRLAPARTKELYERPTNRVNCGDYVFCVINPNDRPGPRSVLLGHEAVFDVGFEEGFGGGLESVFGVERLDQILQRAGDAKCRSVVHGQATTLSQVMKKLSC